MNELQDPRTELISCIAQRVLTLETKFVEVRSVPDAVIATFDKLEKRFSQYKKGITKRIDEVDKIVKKNEIEKNMNLSYIQSTNNSKSLTGVKVDPQWVLDIVRAAREGLENDVDGLLETGFKLLMDRVASQDLEGRQYTDSTIERLRNEMDKKICDLESSKELTNHGSQNIEYNITSNNEKENSQMFELGYSDPLMLELRESVHDVRQRILRLENQSTSVNSSEIYRISALCDLHEKVLQTIDARTSQISDISELLGVLQTDQASMEQKLNNTNLLLEEKYKHNKQTTTEDDIAVIRSDFTAMSYRLSTLREDVLTKLEINTSQNSSDILNHQSRIERLAKNINEINGSLMYVTDEVQHNLKSLEFVKSKVLDIEERDNAKLGDTSNMKAYSIAVGNLTAQMMDLETTLVPQMKRIQDQIHSVQSQLSNYENNQKYDFRSNLVQTNKYLGLSTMSNEATKESLSQNKNIFQAENNCAFAYDEEEYAESTTTEINSIRDGAKSKVGTTPKKKKSYENCETADSTPLELMKPSESSDISLYKKYMEDSDNKFAAVAEFINDLEKHLRVDREAMIHVEDKLKYNEKQIDELSRSLEKEKQKNLYEIQDYNQNNIKKQMISDHVLYNDMLNERLKALESNYFNQSNQINDILLSQSKDEIFEHIKSQETIISTLNNNIHELEKKLYLVDQKIGAVSPSNIIKTEHSYLPDLSSTMDPNIIDTSSKYDNYETIDDTKLNTSIINTQELTSENITSINNNESDLNTLNPNTVSDYIQCETSQDNIENKENGINLLNSKIPEEIVDCHYNIYDNFNITVEESSSASDDKTANPLNNEKSSNSTLWNIEKFDSEHELIPSKNKIQERTIFANSINIEITPKNEVDIINEEINMTSKITQLGKTTNILRAKYGLHEEKFKGLEASIDFLTEDIISLRSVCVELQKITNNEEKEFLVKENEMIFKNLKDLEERLIKLEFSVSTNKLDERSITFAQPPSDRSSHTEESLSICSERVDNYLNKSTIDSCQMEQIISRIEKLELQYMNQNTLCPDSLISNLRHTVTKIKNGPALSSSLDLAIPSRSKSSPINSSTSYNNQNNKTSTEQIKVRNYIETEEKLKEINDSRFKEISKDVEKLSHGFTAQRKQLRVLKEAFDTVAGLLEEHDGTIQKLIDENTKLSRKTSQLCQINDNDLEKFENKLTEYNVIISELKETLNNLENNEISHIEDLKSAIIRSDEYSQNNILELNIKLKEVTEQQFYLGEHLAEYIKKYEESYKLNSKKDFITYDQFIEFHKELKYLEADVDIIATALTELRDVTTNSNQFYPKSTSLLGQSFMLQKQPMSSTFNRAQSEIHRTNIYQHTPQRAKTVSHNKTQSKFKASQLENSFALWPINIKKNRNLVKNKNNTDELSSSFSFWNVDPKKTRILANDSNNKNENLVFRGLNSKPNTQNSMNLKMTKSSLISKLPLEKSSLNINSISMDKFHKANSTNDIVVKQNLQNILGFNKSSISKQKESRYMKEKKNTFTRDDILPKHTDNIENILHALSTQEILSSPRIINKMTDLNNNITELIKKDELNNSLHLNKSEKSLDDLKFTNNNNLQVSKSSMTLSMPIQEQVKENDLYSIKKSNIELLNTIGNNEHDPKQYNKSFLEPEFNYTIENESSNPKSYLDLRKKDETNKPNIKRNSSNFRITDFNKKEDNYNQTSNENDFTKNEPLVANIESRPIRQGLSAVINSAFWSSTQNSDNSPNITSTKPNIDEKQYFEQKSPEQSKKITLNTDQYTNQSICLPNLNKSSLDSPKSIDILKKFNSSNIFNQSVIKSFELPSKSKEYSDTHLDSKSLDQMRDKKENSIYKTISSNNDEVDILSCTNQHSLSIFPSGMLSCTDLEKSIKQFNISNSETKQSGDVASCTVSNISLPIYAVENFSQKSSMFGLENIDSFQISDNIRNSLLAKSNNQVYPDSEYEKFSVTSHDSNEGELKINKTENIKFTNEITKTQDQHESIKLLDDYSKYKNSINLQKNDNLISDSSTIKTKHKSIISKEWQYKSYQAIDMIWGSQNNENKTGLEKQTSTEPNNLFFSSNLNTINDGKVQNETCFVNDSLTDRDDKINKDLKREQKTSKHISFSDSIIISGTEDSAKSRYDSFTNVELNHDQSKLKLNEWEINENISELQNPLNVEKISSLINKPFNANDSFNSGEIDIHPSMIPTIDISLSSSSNDNAFNDVSSRFFDSDSGKPSLQASNSLFCKSGTYTMFDSSKVTLDIK